MRKMVNFGTVPDSSPILPSPILPILRRNFTRFPRLLIDRFAPQRVRPDHRTGRHNRG